ncbi:MAG: phosphotransferase [Eubacteriaceae bacterium]|jgi:5-methylthioribose kinase
MSYLEITRENVTDYVKSRIDYFAPDAQLSVYEFGENEEEDGDGFVNFVYRVWDQNGKSLIVKQAKQFLKKINPGTNPMKQDRNLTEACIMEIKGAIVPQYIPEIYDVDKKNHVYICEDCSNLRILRFEMMRGMQFPNFPEQIGEFLAKTNFYTSEIYMDAVEHRKLQAAFLNPSMRLIFEIGLFLREESAFNEKRPVPPDIDPARIEINEIPWQDENFRTQMLRLRQLHMKKAECLVHGDLHTSNILISQDEMKIIDQEYTYMGLASCDTGYLMGSLLYEYIRWFYMPDHTEEYCARMRQSVLSYMRGMIESYIRIYAECWDRDAKPMYRPHVQYRDQLMKDFMHEVCGASGAQVISRVGSFVPLPDFDTIASEQDRTDACRIAMWTAKYLIINWEKCDNIDIFMDMVEKGVKTSRETIYVFKDK